MSGYGTQAHDLLPLIQKEGYTLACIPFFGLEGGKLTADNITYYPKIADTWGSDAMVAHSQHFNADITISLQDIWVLDPNVLRNIKRWVPIVPIDHDPVPDPIYQRLKMAYRIITYSEFGYKQLKDKGLHTSYIQHTVNTEVLKPANKQKARERFSIPQDVFLFGMVAANKDNPPRKSFQEAMDAFVMFREKHPKSAMFFHTLVNQQGGFPIHEYAKFLGIQKDVYHLPPYDQMFNIGRDEMRDVYNMFDCLLAPSTNEGFGVPIVEAQSCGVPVISHDFTAMSELIRDGETGYLCKTAVKRFTPLLSYVGIPDTRSIYDNMEKVFKTDREKMGRKARQFVLDTYDINKVFKEKWVPFLQKVENEIYPPSLTKS